MNKFLLQIPALLQKPNFCGANQGLINGNTGLVIFLYHFSRITQNAETEKMADNLLDRIFDSLATTAPTDFENGLAGIGWGIEYLVQNGFAEGNTDEILEEVDTKIYKILSEDNLNSFELTNGLTGYLIFNNVQGASYTSNPYGTNVTLNGQDYNIVLIVGNFDDNYEDYGYITRNSFTNPYGIWNPIDIGNNGIMRILVDVSDNLDGFTDFLSGSAY